MACVHTVWLVCAMYNIILNVKHVKGICNIYIDILSRWPHYSNMCTTPVRIFKKCTWENCDFAV